MWSKDVGKKVPKYDKADNFMISDEIYNLISKDLPSYKSLGNIVKLGCGTDRYTKLLAKYESQVIAIDLSFQMSEVDRKKLIDFKNVILKKGNIEEIPLESNKYDTVSSIRIIAAACPYKILNGMLTFDRI